VQTDEIYKTSSKWLPKLICQDPEHLMNSHQWVAHIHHYSFRRPLLQAAVLVYFGATFSEKNVIFLLPGAVFDFGAIAGVFYRATPTSNAERSDLCSVCGAILFRGLGWCTLFQKKSRAPRDLVYVQRTLAFSGLI
jgi:hypothetical protein